MRIITSTYHSVVVSIGIPSINPMGIMIIDSDNQMIQLSSNGLIVTDIAAQSKTAMQISPTLTREFYAYIFGSMPFHAYVSGYIIKNYIEGHTTKFLIPTSPLTFLVNLATRVSAAYSGRPLTITLLLDSYQPGSDFLLIKGFLTDVQFSFSSREDSQIGTFKLDFFAVPP
ncbi:MAG: hypothetical protein QW303_00480 [Nitrososphaerota archaeon]